MAAPLLMALLDLRFESLTLTAVGEELRFKSNLV